jgi:hypothetical protein
MTIVQNRLSLALVLLFLTAGCSSVHIQTGPQTDVELTQQADDSGKRFRAQWSDRLQSVPPLQQAEMLRTFIDSTVARYLKLGGQINDSWREESRKRGTQVPVEEIRAMVERSTRLDFPIIDAYEDVLEFGVDLIKEEQAINSGALEKLVEYRDFYLEVYSAVFYPNGTREEFENQLQLMSSQAEETSRELETELDRMR